MHYFLAGLVPGFSTVRVVFSLIGGKTAKFPPKLETMSAIWKFMVHVLHL